MNRPGPYLLHSAIALALICFPAVAGVLAQPTDWAIEGIIGRVKSFEERSLSRYEKNGKVENDKTLVDTIQYFDEKGRLTKEIRNGLNNISTTYYTYHKGGERRGLTESVRPFEKPTPPDQPKYPTHLLSVFTYDPGENSVLEKGFRIPFSARPEPSEPERWHQFKWYFDKDNKLIRHIFMSPDGKELTTQTYVYPADGRHPVEMTVTSKGRTLQSIKYSYELDANGNWKKRTAVKTPIDPRNPVVTEVTIRKLSYYKN
jgi:hypothetical protein